MPQVECSEATPFIPAWYKSRAAVWVGLAGPPSQQPVRWLVQIGTNSQCAYGGPANDPKNNVKPYSAVWEVLGINGNDQSNPNNTPQLISNFDVRENDLVGAYIIYDSNRQQFTMGITNISTGQKTYVSGDDIGKHITGAEAENSRFYALCILERDPDEEIAGVIPTGGLAEFATPIEWWACEPTAEDQNGLTVKKYEMSNAKVDPRGYYNDSGNAFTVEWQHW